jgi:hypothetical protein
MELVKKGRRTYGAYIKTSKHMIYCAFRTPGDFFLDGKRGEFRSIAQGLQDGSAAWAIDDQHLLSARAKGCTYIAVWVRKLNWIFMTPIESFFDPHKYYRRNYGARGGSDQRYLSTKHFAQRNRPVNLGPITS